MIAAETATACRHAIAGGQGASRLVEPAERLYIPDGSVLVNSPGVEWGVSSEELLRPESAYLAVLGDFVAERGHAESAARLGAWPPCGPAARD